MKAGPKKWRELSIDPLSIPLGSGLTILDIVGYPHAGNDVLACAATQRGRPIDLYLKIARHRDADLSNEAIALEAVAACGLPVPKVLACGRYGGKEYLALSAMPGERLSTLLSGDQASRYQSRLLDLLREMGRSLGRIHSLPLRWRRAKERRQHSLPTFADGNPLAERLGPVLQWLAGNAPARSRDVFIHGDHHYANILWERDEISAILDWELCGQGWREFDLAWATTLRPSQRFLRTEDEVESLLSGYRELEEYEPAALLWCRKLVCCHFLNMRDVWRDETYVETVFAAMQRPGRTRP